MSSRRGSTRPLWLRAVEALDVEALKRTEASSGSFHAMPLQRFNDYRREALSIDGSPAQWAGLRKTGE